MKCKACGYESAYIYEDKIMKEIGDEEFIQIYGTYYIDNKYSFYNEKVQIGLYICPKCNTVIADVDY